MPCRRPQGRRASLCQRGKNGEDALQGPVELIGGKRLNEIGMAICLTGTHKAVWPPYIGKAKMARMRYRGL